MINEIATLTKIYTTHTGLKVSTVSTYAANDGKWLGGLMGGHAGCTIRKADRAIRWFSENWPVDLEWPRDIPRPQAQRGAA